MCPVLSFSPEVESLLDVFDNTHARRFDSLVGRVWYERIALPGPGSLVEQDARTMDAMEFLRVIHDDMVRPVVKGKQG